MKNKLHRTLVILALLFLIGYLFDKSSDFAVDYFSEERMRSFGLEVKKSDTLLTCPLDTVVRNIQYYVEDIMVDDDYIEKNPLKYPCEYFESKNRRVIQLGKSDSGQIPYLKITGDTIGYFSDVISQKYEPSFFLYNKAKVLKHEVIISDFKKDSMMLRFNLMVERNVYMKNDYMRQNPIKKGKFKIDQCLICTKNNSILDTLLSYEDKQEEYSYKYKKEKSPLFEFREMK